MRQIKFRAWDSDTSVMFSNLMDHDDATCLEALKGEFGWIPMQYTGLKDKNGVEIYEGDVVEYVSPSEDEGDPRDRYEVEWRDHGFYAQWTKFRNRGEDGLIHCEEDMIVIGNIYENPELLGRAS